MRKKKYTDDQIRKAVLESESYYGVLRKLDLKLCGGNHAQIKKRIKDLNLGISHFTGKGWCTGDKHKRLINAFVNIPLEKILIKNSDYLSTTGLKKKLFKANLLNNRCYVCDIGPEWNNKPLTLQLDHIDGDRTNNLLTNLRLLCPNCHSQTETFSGCNSRKKPKRPRKYISKKTNNCLDCGTAIPLRNKRCMQCVKSNPKTKINWPDSNTLKELVLMSSLLSVAKQLGVSDNAVRKRLKKEKLWPL